MRAGWTLRAARDTFRLEAMEEMFDARDRHNSKPAVYTTIDSRLQNQQGSSRQWFRTSNAGDVAGFRGTIDSNFNDLVARRADTVRQLHDVTVGARAFE